MSNKKFHKILSDTITLPLLPASNFNETNTVYYAVLEKNYIPITSEIECIYKPDWITGYEFIKEGENENETNEKLKYYNKLVITSISDNSTGKLRKDVMEFAVRNNVSSLTPINHIYAKVSQIPKEDIDVNLEFIPTKEQEGYLNKDGGIISGDKQEIHIKYWAVLNGRNQSNVTLTLNAKLLDKDKIKSLKVNSSDNTVELVYLIDKNIGTDKQLIFDAIFKTQYNSVNQSKTIIQKVNTYTITLDIDKPNPVCFNGDNRILIYKCTYTDGINTASKEIKDNLQLEFSYINTQNQINYSVIKTIYVRKEFKTTINVDENYTSEQRYLNVNVVYDNGSNKLKSAVKQIIQDKSNIKLQYYVEYLDKNTSESPSTNGTYNVSAFGETIRLHYYGIIAIDEKNSVKITNVTNTKNNISTTYAIDALVDNVLYNNVTLNGDEYILDINFDRNEKATIEKTINFNMNNSLHIPSASCTLTQGVLSINLTLKQDKCTEIIGGIPEYNNIILTFRAFDTEKDITIEDINLYTITCDNNDVNLADIQYEIITYDNKNYVVASNIRCKDIYDKKEDRRLTFTVKYNTKVVSHDVIQKSVVYACEIRPNSNYVSALGEDKFEVISVGIINDGYLDKHLETAVDDVKFTYTNNDSQPNYIKVIQSNRKLVNKSQSIIRVEPQVMSGEHITTTKDIVFRIKVKYKDSDTYYDIKQLYLQIYIDLYKESSYSTLLDYESKKLNISPFINNIIYYKCYVCEINKADGTLNKVDISKFQIKRFSISSDDWVIVQASVDENPTYNKEDYTYRGKIIIPIYICPAEVSYQFKYEQGYSNINTKLSIYKQLNIYKPEIRTCTVDNLNPLPGTYIQYRSDKDSSYNDNKSILKIGTDDKRISSKGYSVTLYYRTVFTLILENTDNYIYGNDYKTYIDLDKKHFISFIDNENITIDNNAFENAEEVNFNDSSYLKIIFDVNKNDGLSTLNIYKSIKYEFTYDTIDGTNYTSNAFTNDQNNDNNRIEIYQDGASLDLVAFFDSSNSGPITNNGTNSSAIITYSAYPQSNQNLHVRVLLNDELQPTYSSYFKFTSDSSTFQINDGILDSGLNTYKSEYNLDDIYIEPDNKTYTLYYCYNGVEKNKTNDLTVIRTSFGRDNNCELNANISSSEISNNGDTVKITFYLQYNNGEIIDLGEKAIGNFVYSLNNNKHNFNVTYDSESKKYSFDYKIDANPTTEKKTYTFSIQFGGDDEKHKKELICTQGSSSYKLNATIDPLTLSPLDALNIKIICSVEKDNNGEIYKGVDLNNFSITQTNENETKDENGNNRLTLLDQPPEGLLQYQYGKEYKVANNKTKDPITYKFECSYNLNGQNLTKYLSTTQSGATFDVSIYDSETDQSKQNIVNPIGEIKTINYFGILNDEHILNPDKVKFSYEQEGGGVTLIEEVGEVIPDTENNVLSRKYKFKLNNTPNTIIYKFTVTYQDISKSISFKQKPGDIKLYIKAEPRPIPRTGGNCTIYYYGYVGDDPTNKSSHILDNIIFNYSTEVTDSLSYTPTTVSEPKIQDFQFVYVFSVPPRETDKYIDRILKRNWSITYKNDNVEKTVNIDIEQNGDNEFFPSFDIFGLKYTWTEGGQDLDTATQLSRSDNLSLPINVSFIDASSNAHNNTYDMTQMPLGFSLPRSSYKFTYDEYPYTNESNAVINYMASKYIAFSGDNLSTYGNESIAVDFRNILLDYKLNNITLDFDIWMSWFQGWWDGKIDITFETYNNAEFLKTTTSDSSIPIIQFSNYLYKIKNDVKPTNSVTKTTYLIGKGSVSEFKSEYGKIGRLRYNVKDKSAVLTINNKVQTGNTSNNDNEYRIYKIRCITINNNGKKSIQYSAINSQYISNNMNNITKIAPALENIIDIKYRQTTGAQIYNAPLYSKESYISSVSLYTSATDLNLTETKFHGDTICDNILDLSKYNVTLKQNVDNNIIKIPDINISNSNIPSTYIGIKTISFGYIFTYTYNNTQTEFTLNYTINCNYQK